MGFNVSLQQSVPRALGARIWITADSINEADYAELSIIRDLSGFGNHATAPSIYRPKLRLDALAGRKGLFFAAGVTYMDFGDLSAQFPTAATIFVVHRQFQKPSFNIFNTSGTDGWWRHGPNQYGYRAQFRNNREESFPNPTANYENVAVECVISTSGRFECFNNGVSLGVRDDTYSSYSAGSSYTLNLASNDPYALRSQFGYIFELVVFNRVLTQNELNVMHAYLLSKYQDRADILNPERQEVAFWLDAADIAQSNGTNITSWTDKAKGIISNTKNASNWPTYSTTGANGLPAAFFSSANLLTPKHIASLGGYTVLLVSKTSNASALGRTLSGGEVNWLLGSWGSTATSETAYVGNAFVYDSATFSSSLKVHALVFSEGRGVEYATANYYVNGTFRGGINVGVTPNPRGFCLGSYFDGSELCECYIAELKVWERPLDSTDLTNETNALKTKYGI